MSFLDRRVIHFLKSAHCPSFREAAKKLGITQAALSNSIKSLEQEIKIRLFERSSSGVRLTHEGKEFYSKLRKYDIFFHEELKRGLNQTASLTLRIGSVAYFAERYLLDLFETQAKNFPIIQSYFSRSFDVYRGVETGDFDFGFISWNKRPETLKYIEVWRDSVGVVGLRKKYAHLEQIRRLNKLSAETWIHFPKQQEDWTTFLDPGVKGFVARDISVFKALVLHGAGIGVIQLDVFSEQERKRLAIMREPVSELEVNIYAVYRADIRPEALEYLRRIIALLK